MFQVPRTAWLPVPPAVDLVFELRTFRRAQDLQQGIDDVFPFDRGNEVRVGLVQTVELVNGLLQSFLHHTGRELRRRLRVEHHQRAAAALRVVDRLAQARVNRTEVSLEGAPTDASEAYPISAAVNARLGEKIGGWKVGAIPGAGVPIGAPRLRQAYATFYAPQTDGIAAMLQKQGPFDAVDRLEAGRKFSTGR